MAISFQDSNISMEELLNQSNFDIANYNKGDVVTGKVIGFQPDEENPESVMIGMSSKSEGKISIREFDEKPRLGDEIEALVEFMDGDTGLLFLSKRKLEQARGWEIIQEAFEKEIPVNAVVKREMKQGYLIVAEAISLFLPHSHLGRITGKVKGKKNDLLNSSVTVKILELNARRKTGVASRKVFQDEQNQQFWSNLTDKVKIGDIVDGKVLKHTKAGILIQVHGVQGFLHKSNISWERHQSTMKDKLAVDADIQVRVLEIDPENNRLSLGLKQLTEDPWEKVMQKINVGQNVKGTVSFVARYGAFVDIGQGLEGLLHISEMSWTRKINHAQEIVKLGDEVETRVIGINAEDKRISLGLRQLQQNPWDIIRNDYKIGQKITGKVKDITNFGVFISITPEIDALIRREDVSWDDAPQDLKTLFKKGDEIEAKITELNFEDRKIGCSIRQLLPNPYRDLKRKYPRGTVIDGVVTGVVDFGIFVRFEEKYEGLVHLSAMTKEQSENHKKHFKKGDGIKVVLKNVDPDKRKISLSIRDVEYALEKMEISRYVDKEEDLKVETSSAFSTLKSFVPRG